jgi:hypothetical protein
MVENFKIKFLETPILNSYVSYDGIYSMVQPFQLLFQIKTIIRKWNDTHNLLNISVKLLYECIEKFVIQAKNMDPTKIKIKKYGGIFLCQVFL